MGSKSKSVNDEAHHGSASKKRSRAERETVDSGKSQSKEETPSKKTSKKRKLEQAEEHSEEKAAKKEKKHEKKSKSKATLPDRTAPSEDQEKGTAISTPVKTPSIKRTKSVSFTPDTKKKDGDSVPSTESEAVEDDDVVDEPASPLNPPSNKDLKKAKKEQRKASKAAESAAEDKVPLAPYVTYLQQYHSDRPSWKFSKKLQVDLLKNVFNFYRVPESCDAAVEAYVSGLQGTAARYRLKQQADAALQETSTMSMDDPANRQAAADAALQRQLNNIKKRARDEDRAAHYQSPEFQQLAAKRRRADIMLAALGPVEEPPVVPGQSLQQRYGHIQAEVEVPAAEDGSKKKSRPRKSRTGVPDDDLGLSSDDNSSSSEESSVVSSSSEEESSSEEDDDSSSEDGSSSDSDDSSSEDSSSESEDEEVSTKKKAKKGGRK